MLHAAGRLTIDLARSLLDDGLGLKDGTPYNVLFRGPEPVFIDVLSCERRDPDDPTWLPYAQFVRTFLLPLLANKYLGLSIEQILIARRDGLEPDEVYRWLRPLQRIRPPFLSLVTMPALLGRKHDAGDTSIYRKQRTGNPEKARFILDSLLKGVARTLDRLTPNPGRSSTWSGYMAEKNYTAEHFSAKEAFVRDALAGSKPGRVLDVGESGAAPLVGAVVDDVRPVRDGSEVGPRALEGHDGPGVPVVQDDPPGGRLEGALDQPRRDPGAMALGDRGAGSCEELDRFRLEEAHARALEDLEARRVNGRALGRRQPRIGRRRPTSGRSFLGHLQASLKRAAPKRVMRSNQTPRTGASEALENLDKGRRPRPPGTPASA
jgi:hypothetical protein